MGGSQAFKGRNDIISVIVPDSVTAIEYATFIGCDNLTSITIPFIGIVASDKTTDRYFCQIFGAGGGGGFSSQNVPDTLKTVVITSETVIPERAFHDCDGITKIIIPKGVTKIWSWAFEWCDNLEQLIYSGTIEEFITITKGNYWNEILFLDSKYITEVVCSDGILKIDH